LVEIRGLWLFGGALRGQDCGDIDIAFDFSTVGKNPVWRPGNTWRCPENVTIALIELRRGIKRIDFHPLDEIERLGAIKMRLV
jgi:hypothetical protein